MKRFYFHFAESYSYHYSTYTYRSFSAVVFVEGDHVFEGEITDDVGIQNEEWLTVLRQQITG